MKVLATVAVVLGLLLVAGVAWTAAELHYGNCIAAAQARHPVPVQTELQRLNGSRGAVEAQRRQVAAVNGCSRLP